MISGLRPFALIWAAWAGAYFAAANIALADPVYVEEPKARIRSGPGTDYAVLWEAPRYTPLELLAKYKEWCAVRDFQNDVGWVHQDSIAQGKAAIVTAGKTGVYKSPDLKSSQAFSVEKHYLFRITEAKGEWLKVRDADGEEGWIQGSAVWISR